MVTINLLGLNNKAHNLDVALDITCLLCSSGNSHNYTGALEATILFGSNRFGKGAIQLVKLFQFI